MYDIQMHAYEKQQNEKWKTTPPRTSLPPNKRPTPTTPTRTSPPPLPPAPHSHHSHTDIKEAVFLGHDDSLVACGSDDGCVFLYDAVTGAPLLSLDADEDIVNCIQVDDLLLLYCIVLGVQRIMMMMYCTV